MKQIRKRLTYANVMSSIAVFLLLGGATALAAKTVLPKKSVGTTQLKNNSVTAAKIAKNAVTAAKIQDGAVDGAKVKAGSLTGANIDLKTLGTVPSAARTSQIANIFYAANQGDPPQTILSLAGLTLEASCGGDNQITATTSVPHSVIGVVTAQDGDYLGNIDFTVGETFDFDEGHDFDPAEMYTAQYTRPDGVNVAIMLHDVDSANGPVFLETPQQHECLVAGIAFTN